jgi:hypothetical protein
MATFRIALQTSGAASPAAEKELARKSEDLGYSTPSTLSAPDHLDDQWAAPIALIGTAKEIVETLRGRWESLGFSYIVVHEAEMEALVPVIAELAGT